MSLSLPFFATQSSQAPLIVIILHRTDLPFLCTQVTDMDSTLSELTQKTARTMLHLRASCLTSATTIYILAQVDGTMYIETPAGHPICVETTAYRTTLNVSRKQDPPSETSLTPTKTPNNTFSPSQPTIHIHTSTRTCCKQWTRSHGAGCCEPPPSLPC